MESSRGRTRRSWVAIVVTLLLVAPTVLLVSPAHAMPAHSVVARGGTNIGDGFYTVTTHQTVNGTAFFTNFYCGGRTAFQACIIPGGLTYVPSANLVIVSTLHEQGYNHTRNALFEFNPVTSQYTVPENISCVPWGPYYPGVGEYVLVPCFNDSADRLTSILVVNFTSGAAVSFVADTVGGSAMAYDSANGVVYVGGGDAVEMIDLANLTPVGTLAIAGALFGSPTEGWVTYGVPFAYDPSANSLVVPASGQDMIVANPGTGAVESTVPLPSWTMAIAFDPASDQVLASTFNASTVSVFNGRTFALEGRVTIPACIDYDCSQPNDANQILFDPSHGDAYLVTTMALLTLNLSSLSIVGVVPDYAEGPQASAVFIPSVDQVVGTWSFIIMPNPGFRVQLYYGNYSALTSLLWLPPAVGFIVIYVLVGLAIAAPVAWIVVRWWRGPHPAVRIG